MCTQYNLLYQHKILASISLLRCCQTMDDIPLIHYSYKIYLLYCVSMIELIVLIYHSHLLLSPTVHMPLSLSLYNMILNLWKTAVFVFFSLSVLIPSRVLTFALPSMVLCPGSRKTFVDLCGLCDFPVPFVRLHQFSLNA